MAAQIGQVAQELARQNPWWRDPTWTSRDPDLTDASSTGMHYESKALSDLTPGSLYILRGPRRVGKTVAVKQAIASLLESGAPPTSIVRVAVDGWSAKDLRTLMQNVALPPAPDGAGRYWFFDEVSSVSGSL